LGFGRDLRRIAVHQPVRGDLSAVEVKAIITARRCWSVTVGLKSDTREVESRKASRREHKSTRKKRAG